MMTRNDTSNNDSSLHDYGNRSTNDSSEECECEFDYRRSSVVEMASIVSNNNHNIDHDDKNAMTSRITCNIQSDNAIVSSPQGQANDEDEDEEGQDLLITRIDVARRWLYVSHGFAQLSEVVWQFSLAFFLAAVCHYQSLFLVSSYGLSQAASVFLIVPLVGQWMDSQLSTEVQRKDDDVSDGGTTTTATARSSSKRLFVTHRIIICETISVLLASLCSYLLLLWLPPLSSSEGSDNNHDNGAMEGGGEEDLDEDTEEDLSIFFWLQDMNLVTIACLIGIHIFGALAQVCDQAFTVAMERDWVVQLGTIVRIQQEQQHLMMGNDSDDDDNDNYSSRPKSSTWMAKTNVFMRQLDLGAKILAPAVAGWLLPLLASSSSSSSYSSSTYDEGQQPKAEDLTFAAIFVGIVNLVALLVQYIATQRISHLIPEMIMSSTAHDDTDSSDEDEERDTLQTTTKKQSDTNNTNRSDEDDDNESEGLVLASSSTTSEKFDDEFEESHSQKGSGSFRNGLYSYFSLQDVCYAGLALSLLYVNGLTFGNGIITTYLLFKGMDLKTVGIWRGFASSIGLAGTFVYNWSINKQQYSLKSTGLCSIIYQFACLFISFLSISIANSSLSLGLLIGGVCASRIGLWVFDLAVTQLQQETVPDGMRASVGSIQQSLNALGGLICFALGLVLPNISTDFQYYVFAAVSSVGIAMGLYIYGICRAATVTATSTSRAAPHR